MIWDFVWKVVNFLVLAGIAVWLVRKYDLFERVFGNYRREIRAELDAAARHREEAERIKAETETALQEADRRAEEMRAQAAERAEREKEALLELAREEAERIKAQARLTAQSERQRQLRALQNDVVEQTLARARELVTGAITKQDHGRLLDAFLDELDEESVRFS